MEGLKQKRVSKAADRSRRRRTESRPLNLAEGSFGGMHGAEARWQSMKSRVGGEKVEPEEVCKSLEVDGRREMGAVGGEEVFCE